ncbi:CCDC92 domain-containing protein [Trichonephila clavata]|uniref:CCDC92 domain-containing protein n=1 Tax=Trichonephila clavata TaxID=2740835 RepID=A0A8X6FB82_TRICU|nr:CCDC92 domain-containing protein [Trichonephila clavata]
MLAVMKISHPEIKLRMTQEVQYLPSLSTAKKSANEFRVKLDASGEGTPLDIPDDIEVLREKLRAAQDSIKFLQDEHSLMLKGLHEEIERLQDLCRDLQFRCETSGCLLPDSAPKGNLITRRENWLCTLKNGCQILPSCDWKGQIKCLLYAHPKEHKEALAAFFINSNHPSTSNPLPHSRMQPSRVEHLSREDLPTEMQNSLQSLESQYQSYSSYSSLSDKSVSDDEGFGQRCDADGQSEGDTGLTVKLPPISNLPLVSNRQLVRHQLRIKSLANKVTSDTLAIDQRQAPETSLKRLNKA